MVNFSKEINEYLIKDYESISQIGTKNRDDVLKSLLLSFAGETKMGSLYNVLYYHNDKYYFLGSTSLNSDTIRSLYSVNYVLKLKKLPFIKDLGYHLVKSIIKYMFENKSYVKISSCLEETKIFWDKVLIKLKEEGLITSFECVEDEINPYIAYEKIILYK